MYALFPAKPWGILGLSICGARATSVVLPLTSASNTCGNLVAPNGLLIPIISYGDSNICLIVIGLLDKNSASCSNTKQG